MSSPAAGQSDSDALFVENNQPIKFFIQNDLEPELKEELIQLVQEHGGIVTTKVPLRGYLLTRPGTAEATRLRDTWITQERPDRHLVPHTFVLSCIGAGGVIPQIFREQDGPVTFYIHPAIPSRTVREKAADRILKCGGNCFVNESEARVIILEKDLKEWKELSKKYNHSEDKYLETPQWLKHCMIDSKYEHTGIGKVNLGGRARGATRNEYTEEEDRRLAQYIARRLPDPTMPGRTGTSIYKELVEKFEANEKGYQWAGRHPAQSWQNRYKSNKDRFDKAIASYVEKHGIQTGLKGQHGYKRKGDKPTQKDSGHESSSISEDVPELKTNGKNAPFRVSLSNAPQEDPSTSKAAAVEHPNENGEDIQEIREWGSQWETRVAPDIEPSGHFIKPPRQGKRSLVDADAQQPAPKKSRKASRSKTELDLDEDVKARLETIAKVYRWNIDEVIEVYEATGQKIEITNERIRSIRELVEAEKRKWH